MLHFQILHSKNYQKKLSESENCQELLLIFQRLVGNLLLVLHQEAKINFHVGLVFNRQGRFSCWQGYSSGFYLLLSPVLYWRYWMEIRVKIKRKNRTRRENYICLGWKLCEPHIIFFSLKFLLRASEKLLARGESPISTTFSSGLGTRPAIYHHY